MTDTASLPAGGPDARGDRQDRDWPHDGQAGSRARSDGVLPRRARRGPARRVHDVATVERRSGSDDGVVNARSNCRSRSRLPSTTKSRAARGRCGGGLSLRTTRSCQRWWRSRTASRINRAWVERCGRPRSGFSPPGLALATNRSYVGREAEGPVGCSTGPMSTTSPVADSWTRK